MIKDLAIGFCLGTANIIPGVSGGTFLFIFQIYERVFSILGRINTATTIELTRCMIRLVFKPGKARSLNQTIDFFKKNDFLFLIKLLAGSGVAIVSLSGLIAYLLVYHFSVTYALFFGLILVSIIVPVKLLGKINFHSAVFVFLGAVATIYVTYAVNPYDKVKIKSDTHKAQYLNHSQDTGLAEPATIFSFTGKYTAQEYGYSFICGAVAISAMVLPGISGSLVLILMGEYFEVISAISGLKTLNSDNILFLCAFLLGVVLGGLVFTKLLNALLKKYYDPTMAFLMGLMTGSLYALWPFKKSIVMAHQYVKTDGAIRVMENVRIYTNINVFPDMGTQFYLSLVSFVLGGIIMLFFVKKELMR